MSNMQNKHLFSKMMVAIVLVLSFFTFSGFILPAAVKPAAHQTAMICCSKGKCGKTTNFIKTVKRTDNKHKAGIFLISPFLGFNNLHNLPAAPTPSANVAHFTNPEVGFIYRARSFTSTTDDEPISLR